uniref:Delta-like protein n=1 Tax=Hirondellea gigas TaxID=1518452 RepID=A0A2P2I491_9CRUS
MECFIRLFIWLASLLALIQFVRGSGQFELQVITVENEENSLRWSECCGGAARDPLTDTCPHQCRTAVALCLKEWSVAAEQHSAQLAAQRTQISSAAPLGCTYGYNSSTVLGPSSFTLAHTPPQGHLHLRFTFSWTRSFTLILEVVDVNSTGFRALIDSTTYSGILVPGVEWHTLTHNGPVATVTYRVRVVCDQHYYNTTCNKLCRPRDDQFGHYSCNKSGNKVCVDGWMGATCEKPICKEGCHPEHGDCSRPGECSCRPGWHGELCAQCMPYPGCVNGYCDGTPWTCECHLNWGGILCDRDLNYCGREPCMNGGTCENTAPDQYNCTCPEGFSGDSCEVVDDPCAVRPCANGGTCIELASGFQCTCAQGWAGVTCEEDVDECASSPCAHNGTCVDLVNGFSCNCSQGWEGSNCQFDSDECQGKPCINAVACQNLDGDYHCECRAGWRGKNCDRNINDCVGQCLNGATCIDLVDDYHCACAKGFAGENCQQNINDCVSNPCRNGGECVDQVAAYKCICLVGYSGHLCETDIDLCNPNPCDNGAPCINTHGDYFCYCSDRWFGKNCSDLKPTCDNLPCGGAGVCTKTPDGGQPSFNTCGHHGHCDPPYPGAAYSCICDPGYTGLYCHINVDDCVSSPCKNGGTCVDLVNGFQCVCGLPWEGTVCQTDINECSVNPCLHNSTCIDMSAEYKCKCQGKWKGRTCASSKSHCNHASCRNGGTCNDLGHDFECSCPPGWRGISCQIPTREACSSSPCLNGATCINSGDGFSCVCREGWDGVHCEININDCAPHPCYNGGKCIDGVNWRICECSSGFSGPDCRENVSSCKLNPCAYGSTCIDGVGDYQCICPPGRTGQKCELVTDGTKIFLLDGNKTGLHLGCIWNNEIRPHGSVWRRNCNTCHCSHGKHSCSSVWCGPHNCKAATEPHTSCSIHKSSVCVSGPSEWCLKGPCEAWGDCRQHNVDGNVGPPINPGPLDCRPNHARLSNSCARLTLVLDRERVPQGSHVQRVCEGLRAAWADRHAHTPTPPPVILCSLAANTNQSNHTIEITLSYAEGGASGDIIRAARTLGDLLSRKLTPLAPLAAVTEVKVETTLITTTTNGTASSVLVGVTGVLVLLVVVAVLGLAYWHCSRRHLDQQHMPYAVHSSRNKLSDDPHIEKTNNENEDRLWRYNNSLKASKMLPPALDAADEPSTISAINLSMSSDPNKLTCMEMPLPIPRIPPLTSPDMDHAELEPNVGHNLPASIRKVQNADMERNITPHDTGCKSIQKEINLNSLPLSSNLHEHGYRSSEVVV